MANYRTRAPGERAIGSGRRDKEVTIEALTESGSGTFPVETWATLITTMMAGISMSGAERFRADQLSTRFDGQWEMEYLASMDPERVDVPKVRRLNYLGRVYDITSARLIGRREGIMLDTLSR